ncbi:hypothetical protein JX266_005074 [Neoarthrinium moseri]|uniref:uncharacterized protein n=1 Tax=Neoarthrinium moseri TaxID=1658444 RepID=UPI001FDB2706|nr:uncharacterized protein JN550_006409 [Neoarthrinium moseri]KAI1849113.1 hypothetical protein JX266_005074 [Neoarthrinium moseri]KAI1868493.1 hypothetical protein JN550_006409 [Neoarthrinium moseri]
MSTIAGENVDDIGPQINGVSWALTGVAGVFLGTRIYIRLTAGRRSLWWDDYFLLASWLFLVVDASLSTYGVHLGFGKHQEVVPMETVFDLVLIASVSTVFTLLAAAWSKTSFAITLLQLTRGPAKAGVWAIIISMNLMFIVNAILPFAQCVPTQKVWSIVTAAYSATMDWILAIMAWAIIWRLNMKLKEKVGVAICMSLGIVAGATSILRCIKIKLVEEDDFTYRSGELAIWTVAEIATTIMAASIPVLRVHVRKIVTVHADVAATTSNHPGNDTYNNPYHRSAADGTFLRNLRIASKGSEHRTVITSGHRSSTGARSGYSGGGGSRRGRLSRDRRRTRRATGSLAGGLGPETTGRIVKVDTVVVDYGERRSSDEDTSTLVGDRASSTLRRASIELEDMPDLPMYGALGDLK